MLRCCRATSRMKSERDLMSYMLLRKIIALCRQIKSSHRRALTNMNPSHSKVDNKHGFDQNVYVKKERDKYHIIDDKNLLQVPKCC